MNLERLVKKVESLSQNERDDLLLYALSYGHETLIELAILCGADIHMYQDYPLRRAREMGWKNVEKVLIEEDSRSN